MSKLPIKNIEGRDVGEHDMDDALLIYGKGTQLLHDAAVMHRANKRAGTASTKTKSEVRGTGAKPWRQKGLGRARAGYKQSPIWRGGAVVFGPKPRAYNKKMTRKAARLAFRRAVSERVAAGQVMVLDALELSEPKTKLFADLCKKLEIQGAALFVVDELSENLKLAARNVPKIKVTTSVQLSTYDVLRYPLMVATQAAMAGLEKRLQA